MRLSGRFFVTLTLVAFVAVSCAGSKNGKSTRDRPRSGPVTLPDKIPSSLLPTIAIGVEPCYVFLHPDGDSPFFGPLVKGELVKRIDREGRWMLVWIPRLRISGWVRKRHVYLVNRKTSSKETVPTEYLTVLNILKKWVNIRKSPTTRAKIIFRAKQRQEFLMLNERKGWYQVWIPNLKKKGWVAGSIAVKQRKR